MNWTPDKSDMPISVPENLQELEKLDPARLNAMTAQEIEDRLQTGAEAAAESYLKEKPQGDYANCVLVVSALLSRVGSGIDTKVGISMVAEAEAWAQIGCRSVFPE